VGLGQTSVHAVLNADMNLVITDLGVFEVGAGGLRLTDVAPEVTVEEIRSKTEAGFSLAEGLKLAA